MHWKKADKKKKNACESDQMLDLMDEDFSHDKYVQRIRVHWTTLKINSRKKFENLPDMKKV